MCNNFEIQLYPVKTAEFCIDFCLLKDNKKLITRYKGDSATFMCHILNKDFAEILYFETLDSLIRTESVYKSKKEKFCNEQLEYLLHVWEDKAREKLNYDTLFKAGSVEEYVYKKIKDIEYEKLIYFVECIFVDDASFKINIQEKYIFYKLMAQFNKQLLLPHSFSGEIEFISLFDSFVDNTDFINIAMKCAQEKFSNILPVFLKVRESRKSGLIHGLRYKTNDIENLLNLIIQKMLEKKSKIQKCLCCGKYFVPTTKKTSAYCSNLCPYDAKKTCSEYVKYQKYLYHNQNNETVKLYRQIYNSLNNKYKRCGNEKIWSALKSFKIDATVWREEVKSNPKLENDYLNWLKQKKSEFIKNGR